mgnify:CR=1 FL=1
MDRPYLALDLIDVMREIEREAAAEGPDAVVELRQFHEDFVKAEEQKAMRP